MKLLQCFWACLNIVCKMIHSKCELVQLQQSVLAAFKMYENINSRSTYEKRRLFLLVGLRKKNIVG